MQLIGLDRGIDVFEFCLESWRRRSWLRSRTCGRRTVRCSGAGGEAVHVLFFDHGTGGSDEEVQIRRAYEEGIGAVCQIRIRPTPPITTGHSAPARLSISLAQLQPQAKQVLIAALVRTVVSDRH